MRRSGPPPRPSLVYRDRPGAYAALLREGDALLVRHEDELLLPGGGIDPGETPLGALHREVYEETGWRIGPARRLGVFARHAWIEAEERWARKVQRVYVARPVRRLGPPLETDHFPVWLRAAEAVERLSVEGEALALEAALRSGYR